MCVSTELSLYIEYNITIKTIMCDSYNRFIHFYPFNPFNIRINEYSLSPGGDNVSYTGLRLDTI